MMAVAGQPVSELFKLYLERSDLRPASIEVKQRACDLFVQWFGDPPVGRVLPATAESYRAMLGKTGCKPEGRSPRSVKTYLDNFRPFWEWLRENRYIEVNPFAHVSVKVDDEETKDGFTMAEVGVLMKVCDPLEQIQICLGLLGCRRGEMFNVQLRDVHLESPCPYIELVSKRASGQTWPWGTKNHRRGLIALPQTMQFEGLTVELHTQIRLRMMELGHDPQGYLCVPKAHVEYMLRRLQEGRLTWTQIKDPTGNFARTFRRLQTRAGIRHPKRFHELRAFFVTSMLDAGMPLARVAEAARHRSVRTTMLYDRKSRLSLVEDVTQIAQRAYVSKVS